MKVADNAIYYNIKKEKDVKNGGKKSSGSQKF